MRLTSLGCKLGIHANIEHLLEVIGKFIREFGPDASLDGHPVLVHQIYLLLCHMPFILQYGPLHDQFAMNDLRQKMFGHSITDPIRFFYPNFRHLSGDKHRVKEDDDWKELNEITSDAGYLEAVVSFAQRREEEIRATTAMSALVDLYEKDVESQLFGDDLTAVDIFFQNTDLQPPPCVDYPLSCLHSFLYLDFVYTSKHRTEIYSCYHLTESLNRLSLPLYMHFNKHCYTWLGSFILTTHHISSPHTRFLLACNTSVTTTGRGKAEGLDRINEEEVENMSSCPGNRAKSEAQVRAMSFLGNQASIKA